MKVLAVASYPVEAAATRYRIAQFVPYLRERGIDVTLSPFVSSSAFAHLYDRKKAVRTAASLIGSLIRRVRELTHLDTADVLLVQREAMLFGPPFFERLAAARIPIVLDLDDPTYLGTVHSVYGRFVEMIRWPQKLPELIRMASVVLCGNEEIAQHVAQFGVQTRIVPTVVDLDAFRPADERNATPVIGWIGTQATYGYLADLFPVLERLAEKHRFVLKVVGSSRPAPSLRNIEVRSSEWQLERDVPDFRSLDIGLYPLRDELYARGKSGLKAIQYMAVGIPFVTAPVGVCANIGQTGKTHFLASSADEWYVALDQLLSSEGLRREMGCHGREYALANYTVEGHAEVIASALRESIDVRNRRNRSAA